MWDAYKQWERKDKNLNRGGITRFVFNYKFLISSSKYCAFVSVCSTQQIMYLEVFFQGHIKVISRFYLLFYGYFNIVHYFLCKLVEILKQHVREVWELLYSDRVTLCSHLHIIASWMRKFFDVSSIQKRIIS